MANQEIQARMTLSAVDKTASAFKAVSARLTQVERQAKAFSRTNTAVSRGVASAYAATSRYLAPAAIAYATKAAVIRYAEVERRMNRIGITAGASGKKTVEALGQVQRIAMDTAQPVDDIANGLDALVASGQSLEDALAFLPSVAATAQASGADMVDIATSADAVSRSLGVSSAKMQQAFDIMAAAGKMGKFELKDMAQYVPSLAPAFARVGYQGESGLKKLVAVLQTIRNYTGSSSEAATDLENILNKMGSQDTVKKFATMGVKNLREELEKTRNAGGDVLQRFVELTKQATKGDMSKLPLLFTDAQFLAGMNAMLNGEKATKDMVESLNSVDGTVLNDLGKVLDDNQAKIQNLSTSWDTFITSFGGAVADPIGGVLDGISGKLEWQNALARGKQKRGLSGTLWGYSRDEMNRIAFEGGWRADDMARRAEKATRALSPERGGGSGWSGAAPSIPVPAVRPTPMGDMAAQYAQYGFAQHTYRMAGTRLENAVDPGPSALKAFDPNEFEAKLKSGGFQAAEEIAKGGADAGQQIGDAASGRMKSEADAIGAALGSAAARALNAQLSAITLRVAAGGGISSGRVNADTGRSGGDVINKGMR